MKSWEPIGKSLMFCGIGKTRVYIHKKKKKAGPDVDTKNTKKRSVFARETR